jgi:hypothetical protein
VLPAVCRLETSQILLVGFQMSRRSRSGSISASDAVELEHQLHINDVLNAL